MALRTEIIRIVRGDEGYSKTVTLRNSKTKAPIDLTGVTSANLKFRAVGSTTLIATITMTVIDATGGQLQWTWPTNSLAGLAAGRYEAEIEMIGASRKQTPYQRLQFILREDF